MISKTKEHTMKKIQIMAIHIEETYMLVITLRVR